jgi:hypothetical protein
MISSIGTPILDCSLYQQGQSKLFSLATRNATVDSLVNIGLEKFIAIVPHSSVKQKVTGLTLVTSKYVTRHGSGYQKLCSKVMSSILHF